MAVLCYIGMGGNLGRVRETLESAICELAAADDITLLGRAALYRSAAIGTQVQPDYINTVAQISTTLSALDLLDRLLQIENSHGRVREVRWGSRTLDLDLLLYGAVQIVSDRLVVPHPRMGERAFVIYPLYELASELMIPGLGSVESLYRALDGTSQRIERLEEA